MTKIALQSPLLTRSGRLSIYQIAEDEFVTTLRICILSYLLFSTPVIADPIYLHCRLTDHGLQTTSHELTIDESNRSITHKYQDGGSFIAEGHFFSNEISYVSVSESLDIEHRITFTIDRTTLKMTLRRLATYMKSQTPDWAKKSVDRANSRDNRYAVGKCEVVDVSSRKI